MTDHECIEHFETPKVDECSGEGYNRCFGVRTMMLEVWFQDTAFEEHCDNWMQIKVNYCPYCGLKAQE